MTILLRRLPCSGDFLAQATSLLRRLRKALKAPSPPTAENVHPKPLPPRTSLFLSLFPPPLAVWDDVSMKLAIHKPARNTEHTSRHIAQSISLLLASLLLASGSASA